MNMGVRQLPKDVKVQWSKGKDIDMPEVEKIGHAVFSKWNTLYNTNDKYNRSGKLPKDGYHLPHWKNYDRPLMNRKTALARLENQGMCRYTATSLSELAKTAYKTKEAMDRYLMQPNLTSQQIIDDAEKEIMRVSEVDGRLSRVP